MFLSLGQSLAHTGNISAAFKGQEIAQVLVALLMFGYYLGKSLLEKSNYAYFLSGFLGISLAFGIGLVYSQGIGGLEIIGLISTGGTGLFFGSTKQVLGNKIDNFAKWFVHLGGWSFHGTLILASLSIGAAFPTKILTFLILIVIIVWGLIILRRS